MTAPPSRNLDADEDLSVFGKNIGRLCIIASFLAPPHNTGQRRNRLRLHLQKSGDFWRWSPLDRSNRPSWKNFEYAELAAATDNFCSDVHILHQSVPYSVPNSESYFDRELDRKGGHAEVYKGYLPNGELVAVKRLIKDDIEEEDRVSSSECLEWKIRFKIALGIAEWIAISDFGLAKWLPETGHTMLSFLLKEHLDPRLGDTYDPIEMKRATLTASMCIHHLPTMRPHMNQVVKLLRGEDGSPDLKHKTSFKKDSDFGWQ
ncbi:hypothetical protein JRO89_XSUnG0082900 [Xanthoceras sorbifolium]|uniref:Uncharacterized protein n=1 Tax=Xanthoceras sorbifolium TaxID=99658 RepID=A0ABQ8GZJ9_9ROSI|nr:hypothetical protein JRO89_XSUnG0082900 [Xanthoceras sorbifolium]